MYVLRRARKRKEQCGRKTRTSKHRQGIPRDGCLLRTSGLGLVGSAVQAADEMRNGFEPASGDAFQRQTGLKGEVVFGDVDLDGGVGPREDV